MILFSVILNSFVVFTKLPSSFTSRFVFTDAAVIIKLSLLLFGHEEKKKKGRKEEEKTKGNMVLNIHRNLTKDQSANVLRILAVIV